MKFRLTLHNVLLLLLAFNYFSFRTELYDEEHKENTPKSYGGISLLKYSVNWETFDKDNAPKAFTINTATRIQLLYIINSIPQSRHESYRPFQPVRDKSPPIA